MVLDLRGNAGGSLAAMLTVAAYFYGPDAPLAAGTVQVQRFDPASGTWQTAPWTHGDPARPSAAATFTGPLAVLVDDACAGACELLAALLQSSGRGTIVAQTGTAGVAGSAPTSCCQAASSSPTRGRYAVGAPLADGAIHGAGVAPDVRAHHPGERDGQEHGQRSAAVRGARLSDAGAVGADAGDLRLRGRHVGGAARLAL
ncbi:MAG: S41 family peptidase [Caldilineaceae bacterium]